MNLKERLAQIEAELRSIHEDAGDEALTAEAQERWDALSAERSDVRSAIAKDEERRALARDLATRPANVESGDGTRGAPAVHIKRDPYKVLEDRSGMSGSEYRKALVDANLRSIEGKIDGGDNEAHYERLLKRHASDTAWAANLLARSRPEYESGWAKLMAGRSELLTAEERAAIAVGTNTQGGYLVPTHLDPSLILTNAGSSNVMRGLARVVTLTGGANVWHGVTTAGVTASWDAELTEVSDDSPSVGSASIPVRSAKALVSASIEAFEDIANLGPDVLMLFADARDRLEGAAHMTGSGSGQPTGIFTALDANTNVEITSTTAATIGEVDIHAVYRSVGQRWRGKGTWVMNPLYSLAIKRLGTAVSSSYSGDLTTPVSDRILGRPVVESDDAPNTQTTTALDNEIVFGDFSNYVIVDKPGSTSVEFIPHLFNTANNLPDGRRAWYMHFRTGAGSVNDSAFRLLQDKTSA
ncbi:phage major capsid protein [Microbispora bryophytorum]|uniref:phage major capsid protein n=1 Tax=Microbispora bryophytorum TaxID=1460882 RepID=UPI0033EB0AA2